MLTTALAFTIYACSFEGGPLWSRPLVTHKGYIVPAEATAEVLPTIRLVEEKIPSAAWTGAVWGYKATDGRVGMVLSIFAPGNDEPVATQIVEDLRDPLDQPFVSAMLREHGTDLYYLRCEPASFEAAK